MAALSPELRTRLTLTAVAASGVLAGGAKAVGEAGALPGGGLLGWWATWPGYLALSLGFVAAARAFLLGRAWGAGVLFVCASVAAQLDVARRGTPMASLEIVLAGALLAGWLAGWLVGRAPAAHEAACGVFGACLVLAATAKLGAAGWGWFDGDAQAHLVLERALGTWGPLRDLRLTVAAHPAWCSAGAAATLVVELAGAGQAFPRARPALAVATVGLFAGLLLVLGIFQPGWMIAAVGLAHGGGAIGAPAPTASARTGS